jgi:hypothetical protein
MVCKYAGSDWVKRNKQPMSPLGEKVADILGQAFRGIYHISKDIRRADLTPNDYIEMTFMAYGGVLSTFDGAELTYLVVLCHDAGVRLEIEPCNPRYLKLCFSRRRSRTGSMSHRMPTIEDHVKFIHEKLTCDEIVLKEESNG